MESKFMIEPEAIKLLQAYDIDYPMNFFVSQVDDAIRAGNAIGYPIVMKVVSKDIVHKSDAGGVVVNINSQEEVRDAYKKIHSSVKQYDANAVIDGMLLCEQATNGQEVIIGCVNDDIFGPTIMFGLGGIFVEVLKDVTFRVCPINQSEALEMISEINAKDILFGARGQKKLDVAKLAHLISEVSQMVVENKSIKEVDLNPVRVYEDGISVLDARIINY